MTKADCVSSSARSNQIPPEIAAVREIRGLVADELERMVGLLDRLDLLLDGDADGEVDDEPEDDDPDHGIEDVGHDQDDNGVGDGDGLIEQKLTSSDILNGQRLYESFMTERYPARSEARRMIRKAKKLRRARR